LRVILNYKEYLNGRKGDKLMASCEKCWNDAEIMANEGLGDKVLLYHKLLKSRKNNPCLPKKQAGQFWDEEKKMDSRIAQAGKETL